MSQEAGATAADMAGAAGGAEQGQASSGASSTSGQEQGQSQRQGQGQSAEGAASAGKTLLTQQDEAAGQQQAQKDDVQKTPGDAEAAAAVVPDKPDGYALKFADGLDVDNTLLGGFKNTAHELGLNQNQAQKLADMYVKHMTDSAKSFNDAQTKALSEAQQGWEKEITSRPAFKQEASDARRVMAQYGSPELNAIMDQSLMGSHPVFFDFVVKVGKALAEPDVRGMAGSDKKTPLADRLWPNMK